MHLDLDVPACGPPMLFLRSLPGVVRLKNGATLASPSRETTHSSFTFLHDFLFKPQGGFEECYNPFSELLNASENFISVHSPSSDESASGSGRRVIVPIPYLMKSRITLAQPAFRRFQVIVHNI